VIEHRIWNEENTLNVPQETLNLGFSMIQIAMAMLDRIAQQQNALPLIFTTEHESSLFTSSYDAGFTAA
jgi:hypothetical protein